MRHGVAGRKLGRRTSHKEAMLQNMVCSLFRHGRIFTTLGKAKEAAPLANHLIAVAKKGDLAGRRYVLRFMPDKEVVKKLFDVIVKWNPERKSGFTRILRVGTRKGDAAPVVLLELIDKPQEAPKEKEKKKEKAAEKTQPAKL